MKDVGGNFVGAQRNVVPISVPLITRVGEEIVSQGRNGVAKAEFVHVEMTPTALNVVRIEVHDDEDHV